MKLRMPENDRKKQIKGKDYIIMTLAHVNKH